MIENSLHDFAKMTFNKQKMKESLPYPVYLKWKNAIRNQQDLDRETADAIAHAMKTWAIENGATHYAHWFFPLNGVTAKKHESFMDRTDDLEPMIRFSGKELIKGEPDASSFPSGGMRSTFEARGYTYWDCTANSFIIDNILYIPSIFVSYHGEKLDKRGPLLESMNLVGHYGAQIANLFAKDQHTYRVRSKVGLEQEFFLVDEKLAAKRPDILNCDCTLIGAKPSKGQELDDHYFGSIPKRVMDFYADLNAELYKLGIYAKTEHNEAAPCQFEIAVLFENTNVTIDNNHLCMSLLRKIAKKHGLKCLLHEKPFKGVNGSGKHNNYSLATNYGLNCFDPGDNPQENLLFLVFLTAMIASANKYATLLRVASSSPSNDARLGAQEAPPAIISIFLGEDLEEVLRSIEEGDFTPKMDVRDIKINNLAYVPRDLSDRNRTSPFAFTGNKFEFRMLGSSLSAADVNIVLNTAMADTLKNYGERLKDFSGEELKQETYALIREEIHTHERILYSGDNYSDAWKEEAERRGLPSYPTFYEALKSLKEDKSVEVYINHGIFTKEELFAIYEIGMEEVVKVNGLQGRTLLSMVQKDVLPSALEEINFVGQALEKIKNPGLEDYLKKLNENVEELYKEKDLLKEELEACEEKATIDEKAEFLQEKILPKLKKVREICDNLEEDMSRRNWSLPTYEELFNSVM